MKVLIIKTGFSETFTPEISETVSLGDVLRTTAILQIFEAAKVTWLTSDKAVPLLYNNKKISRILTYSLGSYMQLREERFDTIVNLEKFPGLCSLSNVIDAWSKYGFRFDKETGKARAYQHATEALYIATCKKRKAENKKHWLKLLYEMMGCAWDGQQPELGYTPSTPQCKGKIGLNIRVGEKFNKKAWKMKNWARLSKVLRKDYQPCFQPEPTTLTDYFEWMNSCELVVTNDSLGLHLAMALNKKVVGLFGVTPSSEIQPYSKGIMIQGKSVDDIPVEAVEEAIGCLQKEN